MTTSHADRYRSFRVKIEENRPSYATALPPGGYAYLALMPHVATDSILFADVAPDQERSTHEQRSGRIFIVTERALFFAGYTDAPHTFGTHHDGLGSIDLDVHARNPAESVHLSWRGRNLAVPIDDFSHELTDSSLSKGALQLSGHGWSVDLPGEAGADRNQYVDRLMEAFGLIAPATS